MSREVRYRTQIVIPQPELVRGEVNIKDRVLPNGQCMQMLKDSVAQVATENSGTVGRHYLDCNGRKHDCLLSVSTADYPRGIGIQVSDVGKVTFVYDAQAKGKHAARNRQSANVVCQAIAQAYAARAMHRALRACGFQTSDRVHTQAGHRHVLIQGVKKS